MGVTKDDRQIYNIQSEYKFQTPPGKRAAAVFMTDNGESRDYALFQDAADMSLYSVEQSTDMLFGALSCRGGSDDDLNGVGCMLASVDGYVFVLCPNANQYKLYYCSRNHPLFTPVGGECAASGVVDCVVSDGGDGYVLRLLKYENSQYAEYEYRINMLANQMEFVGRFVQDPQAAAHSGMYFAKIDRYSDQYRNLYEYVRGSAASYPVASYLGNGGHYAYFPSEAEKDAVFGPF